MTNVGIIISAKLNAEGETESEVPHKSQFTPFLVLMDISEETLEFFLSITARDTCQNDKNIIR